MVGIIEVMAGGMAIGMIVMEIIGVVEIMIGEMAIVMIVMRMSRVVETMVREVDMVFDFFRFDSLDENEDGIITRKEAETLGRRIFGDYDNDDSGSLSSKEFISHNQDKAQKYAELNYKKLTGEREIQERSKNDFIRLDENKDG